MKSVSSDPFINCVKAKMDLKLLFLFKSHSSDKQNVVFPESGKWNNWLHVNGCGFETHPVYPGPAASQLRLFLLQPPSFQTANTSVAF